MNSYDSQTPDLATILRSLSGQQSAQSAQAVPVIQQPVVPSHLDYQNNTGSYGAPYQFEQQLTQHSQPVQAEYPPWVQGPHQHLAPTKSPVPEVRPHQEPIINNKPSPDPTAITSWPPALRYVTKQATENDKFTERIKKLIKSQHDHEKQWAEGREKLIQDRNKREEGRNAINDVLRAVGGLVDSAPAADDLEDDATILAKYDRKVHLACMEMVKSITSELTSLGIPFFSIKRSLIEDPAHPGDESLVESPGNRLTPSTLKDLQKRMLELLEDLCKE